MLTAFQLYITKNIKFSQSKQIRYIPTGQPGNIENYPSTTLYSFVHDNFWKEKMKLISIRAQNIRTPNT